MKKIIVYLIFGLPVLGFAQSGGFGFGDWFPKPKPVPKIDLTEVDHYGSYCGATNHDPSHEPPAAGTIDMCCYDHDMSLFDLEDALDGGHIYGSMVDLCLCAAGTAHNGDPAHDDYVDRLNAVCIPILAGGPTTLSICQHISNVNKLICIFNDMD